MTYSQHAVPQNIMDVEFKIVGDLTMRQFVYLLVFGGIAYGISTTMVGIFKWPLFGLFVIIGLGLAFVPIEERGMDEWVVNFIKAMYAPTQRLWKKEAILPTAFTQHNLTMFKQEMITLAPTSSRRKLEEYLEFQGEPETSTDPLDIPEQAYLKKVKDAFSDLAVKSMPAVAPIAPSQVSVALQPQQAQQNIQQNQQTTQQSPQQYKPFQPQVNRQPASEQQKKQQQTPAATQQQQKKESQEIRQQVVTKVSPQAVQKQEKVSSKPVKRTYPHMQAPSVATGASSHVGRRFTNMLPSEGSLILPVRGEVILKTTEEQHIDEDIENRTEQLRTLLDRIKGDEKFRDMVASPESVVPDESSTQKINEAQTAVKQFKQENEKLSNEIEKLKSELQVSESPAPHNKQKVELIKKLEQEKSKASQDYSALQKQVLELQRRLREKTKSKDDSEPKNIEVKTAKMQPITSTPNIISGVLLDKEAKPIDGSVILIKNHKGEAVRAVKTNSIGQFSISTALTNGMYSLEVGTKSEGLTFDIITVEVKGEVIPPIEIQGRPV